MKKMNNYWAPAVCQAQCLFTCTVIMSICSCSYEWFRWNCKSRYAFPIAAGVYWLWAVDGFLASVCIRRTKLAYAPNKVGRAAWSILIHFYTNLFSLHMVGYWAKYNNVLTHIKRFSFHWSNVSRCGLLNSHLAEVHSRCTERLLLWVMILFSKFYRAVQCSSLCLLPIPLRERKMSGEGLNARVGRGINDGWSSCSDLGTGFTLDCTLSMCVGLAWPGHWSFLMWRLDEGIWGWYGAYLLVEISWSGKCIFHRPVAHWKEISHMLHHSWKAIIKGAAPRIGNLLWF